MIPKIIHTSWISDDKIKGEYLSCLRSWSKLHGYKLIIWNTKNFNFTISNYVREAFSLKEWAFCADYIRVCALYNYGGIWLDLDIAIVKPFDDLLNMPYFLSNESIFEKNSEKTEKYKEEIRIEAGVMGVEKKSEIFKIILDYYNNLHFIDHSRKWICNNFGSTKINNKWISNSIGDMTIPITIQNALKKYKTIVFLNKSKCNINEYKDGKKLRENPKIVYILPGYYFARLDILAKDRNKNDVYSLHRHQLVWAKQSAKLNYYNYNRDEYDKQYKLAEELSHNIEVKFTDIP